MELKQMLLEYKTIQEYPFNEELIEKLTKDILDNMKQQEISGPMIIDNNIVIWDNRDFLFYPKEEAKPSLNGVLLFYKTLQEFDIKMLNFYLKNPAMIRAVTYYIFTIKRLIQTSVMKYLTNKSIIIDNYIVVWDNDFNFYPKVEL